MAEVDRPIVTRLNTAGDFERSWTPPYKSNSVVADPMR